MASRERLYHECLEEKLHTHMDFIPCKVEPDIWMRDQGDHYEYIAVYTADLTIASNNPEAIVVELEDVPGPLNFLLGCFYIRYPHTTYVPKVVYSKDEGHICASVR